MKRIKKNIILKLSMMMSILVIALFFNNCKGSSEGALELQSINDVGSVPNPSSNGDGNSICEDDLLNLYSRSWQPFLKTNCAICHSNGPGKGRFATNDTKLAFEEFMQVGFVKVAANAVNPTHNPPHSGIHHTEAVNSMKVEWQTGLIENSKCNGTTTETFETQAEKITLKSKEQSIGLAADGEKKVLTWTINSDLVRTKGTEALPNIPNGKISITVTRLKNGSGTTYYNFSNPTLHGAIVDTRVQGIFININGFLLRYPTTFSFVDKSVRKESKNDISGLISIGSLVAPKTILTSDTASLSFINISPVVLPPEPAPVSVSMGLARTFVVPKGAEFIDIPLVLSSPALEPVVVTLTEDQDLCGKAITVANANSEFKTVSATCLKEVYDTVCPGGTCAMTAKEFGRAKSIVGTTWNRFDWDYRFPTGSVTFGVGESTKKLRVYFSRDIRLEKNRVLTLGISTVLGSAAIGTNNKTHFIINKHNNPVPNGNVLTFSELMNESSGILGLNCVKCHNSVKFSGGYDMTNYDMMIKNEVLIPGDVRSKMYVRMHDTGNTLVKPMPNDGYLPNALILEVERWLLNGALNN